MIRRRGRIAPPRAAAPVIAAPAPTSACDHVVLQRNLKCPCGERAFIWARCVGCRQLVATCGGHGKTVTQLRDEHCPTGAP